MNTLFTPEEVYSISSFVRLCKKTLDNHIPTSWIQGEISNLSRPSSGHLYFSLKDKNAQIRCVLFRQGAQKVPFKLENGTSILVRASTTIYEARGDFQVIIEQVETLGLGNLQRAFDQLKQQLLGEGLFEQKYKKTLPENPQTIGVITSKSGSVIQDILHIIKRRHPSATMVIFNSLTQGELCPEQIINALNQADDYGCDVLIVARGGGSLEDLWCFNEEVVARAIFALKTPIVSAIGHETDTTIADFVADVRAPTPSAAAEITTPNREQKLHNIQTLERRLNQVMSQLINQKRQQVQWLVDKMSKPSVYIEQASLKLDDLQHILSHNIASKIQQSQHQTSTLLHKLNALSPQADITYKQQQLQHLSEQLQQQTSQNIKQNQQRFVFAQTRLTEKIANCVSSAKQPLQKLSTALSLLSPLNTLDRGYSITLGEEGTAITDVSQLQPKDNIKIMLAKGSVDAVITQIKTKA